MVRSSHSNGRSHDSGHQLPPSLIDYISPRNWNTPPKLSLDDHIKKSGFEKGNVIVYADASPAYGFVGTGTDPIEFGGDGTYKLAEGSKKGNVVNPDLVIPSGAAYVSFANDLSRKLEGLVKLYASSNSDEAFRQIRDYSPKIVMLSPIMPNFQDEEVKKQLEQDSRIDTEIPSRALLEYVLHLNKSGNHILPVIVTSYEENMGGWAIDFYAKASKKNILVREFPKSFNTINLGELIVKSIITFNSLYS